MSVSTTEVEQLGVKLDVLSVDGDALAPDETTVELTIPDEAVGRIIGAKGVHIKMLQQIPKIARVQLIKRAPDNHVLLIVGDSKAVADVINTAQNAIYRGQITSTKQSSWHHSDTVQVLTPREGRELARQRALSNQSRAVHSWQPSRTGQILTPREVHKTGEKPPPKGSKKWEREQQRIREVSQRFERGVPEFVSRTVSKKEGKERNNEFELAREQFEKVKAARASAAASK